MPYCSTSTCHQHRCQSIKVVSPSGSAYLISSTREGKRTADEEAEEPSVKKARIGGDGDEDMMSATELSTSECTSLLFSCRFMMGTDCYRP